MKKIAIIIDGDLINRKGQVNASLNRIKHLKEIADYQIDVFAIQQYEGFLVRLFRKTIKRERISSMNIDGINIKLLWSKFSLINYLLVYKFKYKPLFRTKRYKRNACLFQEYDLISAHSISCGRLALAVYKRYGISYYATWHGSDIHTLPYNNKYNKIDTIKVIENAKNNFFVSQALLESSNNLTVNARKQVLYNGKGKEFFSYSKEKRISLKQSLNVAEKKVVAFIGNLFSIKNVLLLPEIFKEVAKRYKGEVIFWIIGDGKLRCSLQQLLLEYEVNCRMWGNQPTSLMPDFMNVVDVLVLPSKNEGLPLVTVEALACGSNAVGSNVGGIPEVLGKDNVFNLDDAFINNISNRIVQILENEIKQPLSKSFDWHATANIENNIYKQELDKQSYSK